MFTDWRYSYISLTLIIGVFVSVSTEILSVFHWLTPLGIYFAWGLLIAALLYFRTPFLMPSAMTPLNKQEIALLVAIAFQLIVLGMIAYLAPPNTWDSMGYHMARISHWMQNHTLAYYPTHDQRQLWKCPFAEYAILHLQLLTHGDHFANFIQWSSLLGNSIAASLIAKEFGLDRKAQLLSALIVVTLPMGILQATSTQNDLVSSYWLLCFTCLIFLWRKNQNYMIIGGIGASLGLALLTKEINYVYALPLGLWLLWMAFTKKLNRKIVLLVSLVVGVLLLNGPHYARNIQLYQKPLSSSDVHDAFIMTDHSPRALLSNTLLNFASQWQLPLKKFNQTAIDIFAQMHQQLLGVSVEASPANMSNFALSADPLHEDHAGNLLHLILILFAIGAFIFNPKLRTSTSMPYFWAICGTYLIFIWFMKWQPFNNRLQIILFILFAPIAALAITHILRRWIIGIALALILAGLPWLLCNYSRPFLGEENVWSTPRAKQYFRNYRGAYLAYKATGEEIIAKQCHDVGYTLGEDSFEYPLWIRLYENNPSLRFERIMGDNLSFKKTNYPLGAFDPCIIVTIGSEAADKIMRNDKVYVLSSQTAYLDTYVDVAWYVQNKPKI